MITNIFDKFCFYLLFIVQKCCSFADFNSKSNLNLIHLCMKKIFLWVKQLFIKDHSQIKIGSIVKFQAILQEIRGIVEEIRGKKAKVFYLNYGSSSIINWISLSSLTVVA